MDQKPKSYFPPSQTFLSHSWVFGGMGTWGLPCRVKNILFCKVQERGWGLKLCNQEPDVIKTERCSKGWWSGVLEVEDLLSTSSLHPRAALGTRRRMAGPNHQSSQPLQGSQCSCYMQSLLRKRLQP